MSEHLRTLNLESDWLPQSELERLIDEVSKDFPGVSSETADSRLRALDPVVASALIAGFVAILGPFLTKLAERLFRAEPASKIVVEISPQSPGLVIDAQTQDAQRAEITRQALASNAPVRIRIIHE